MHAHFAIVSVAWLVTSCGSSAGSPAPDSGSGAPVSVGAATTTAFGTILVGPNGMSLYTRDGDTATMSTCTGSCIMTWPPLTVTLGQQAVGGPGVNGTFATFTRSDGAVQATYEGHPLYFSQGDKNPGDVTGDGLAGFAVAKP